MYSDAKIGGVGIWLDEIVPCLKDTETGEIRTSVVFLKKKSPCSKFSVQAVFSACCSDCPLSI